MTTPIEPQTEAINGLLDTKRAAARLGVDSNTFKVWASRSKTSARGIPSLMPKAVGSLNGSVYLEEDIHILKKQLAERPEFQDGGSMMNPARKKLLGSYFTPSSAAELMARWSVRSPHDVVLEPSLGDGQFVRAVTNHASVEGWGSPKILAAEIDPATASAAVSQGCLTPEDLHVGDFLSTSFPPVDVVIGNPPYVRLRAVDSKQKESAQKAMMDSLGCQMDVAGSLWMPFVAKSTSQLKIGGRLALVLPLDFTYVRYARSLWQFLGANFGHIMVLRFQKRVFTDILQNVLILLADEKGKTTPTVDFFAAESINDFDQSKISDRKRLRITDIVDGRRVFQRALISDDAIRAYEELLQYSSTAATRAKFNIGYVAGNKKFFHPTAGDVSLFGIPENSLLPAAVSTRQLSGAGLRTSSMHITSRLWLPGSELTAGEIKYVRTGEDTRVDQAYKCQIRNPWFRVPGVKKPDVLLSVFSDRPTLHLNDAGWVASNSVLCGYLKSSEKAEPFAQSWYTALSLLSTELEVHSLGGGVMIAVPREADSIRLLDAKHVRDRNLEPLNSYLRNSSSEGAYRDGDPYIDALIGRQGTDLLWSALEEIGRWRRAKG